MKITSVLTTLGLGLWGTAAMAQAEGEAMERVNTLEELKAECARYASDNQIKPFKVDVSCNVTETLYVQAQQAQPTTQTLGSTRSVSTALTMKNLELTPQPFVLPIEGVQVGCEIYEQVKRTASTTTSIQCADLAKVQDLRQYCFDEVSARAEEDPEVFKTNPTGLVFNTCSDPDDAAAAPAVDVNVDVDADVEVEPEAGESERPSDRLEEQS